MGASTLTGIILKLLAGALSDLFRCRCCSLVARPRFATLPFTFVAVSPKLAFLIVLRFVHGLATAIFGPVAPRAAHTLHRPPSVAHR
jgi:MFS transporter, DHA1 family, multidrug resistance protein